MVCGVLNISVAGDLATSLGTRGSLDRKATAELPYGLQKCWQQPRFRAPAHAPAVWSSLVAQVSLWSLVSQIIQSRKTRNTYATVSVDSEVFSVSTLSRMQWAVHLSVHLCIWWHDSKFFLKGDMHELNKSTDEEETTLNVTVSSVQSTGHKEAPSSLSQQQIHPVSNYGQRR